MFELNNKEKERIGKLLKYYRKKNKIQWKVIKEVISTSTYSNMEKGKVYKDITLYENLFDFFKMHYRVKENFEIWLKDYLIRFNNILEEYKEEEFDLLIDELEIELGPYKNTVIYEQYYLALSNILNYYKCSRYMTFQEIEDCLSLVECFELEDTIMVYLIEVMFISNNNSIANDSLVEILYSLIQRYKQYPIIWYIEAVYYKLHAMFDTALETFNRSFEFYYKMNNKYRLVKSLMGQYIIYMNIDFKKAEETADKLMTLKKENNLYESMIPSINFNIGMYYYLNNNYEKAYELFLENINIYKTVREWFYICAICTQLNISIPKEFGNYSVKNNEDEICMQYFYMKFNQYSNKELVTYIMKVVLPQWLVNQKYRQPYWKVFEEELFALRKKDKRFNDSYFEFVEIEKKTCKNG